jgi:hypothetical protein
VRGLSIGFTLKVRILGDSAEIPVDSREWMGERVSRGRVELRAIKKMIER